MQGNAVAEGSAAACDAERLLALRIGIDRLVLVLVPADEPVGARGPRPLRSGEIGFRLAVAIDQMGALGGGEEGAIAVEGRTDTAAQRQGPIAVRSQIARGGPADGAQPMADASELRLAAVDFDVAVLRQKAMQSGLVRQHLDTPIRPGGDLEGGRERHDRFAGGVDDCLRLRAERFAGRFLAHRPELAVDAFDLGVIRLEDPGAALVDDAEPAVGGLGDRLTRDEVLHRAEAGLAHRLAGRDVIKAQELVGRGRLLIGHEAGGDDLQAEAGGDVVELAVAVERPDVAVLGGQREAIVEVADMVLRGLQQHFARLVDHADALGGGDGEAGFVGLEGFVLQEAHPAPGLVDHHAAVGEEEAGTLVVALAPGLVEDRDRHRTLGLVDAGHDLDAEAVELLDGFGREQGFKVGPENVEPAVDVVRPVPAAPHLDGIDLADPVMILAGEVMPVARNEPGDGTFLVLDEQEFVLDRPLGEEAFFENDRRVRLRREDTCFILGAICDEGAELAD
ncbi:hypothetical protein CH311_10645 [Afifella marina DSM 2698]|nr:hypothetical protein CH311_10645 [Afifella marina DSM 2698]